MIKRFTRFDWLAQQLFSFRRNSYEGSSRVETVKGNAMKTTRCRPCARNYQRKTLTGSEVDLDADGGALPEDARASVERLRARIDVHLLDADRSVACPSQCQITDRFIESSR